MTMIGLLLVIVRQYPWKIRGLTRLEIESSMPHSLGVLLDWNDCGELAGCFSAIDFIRRQIGIIRKPQLVRILKRISRAPKSKVDVSGNMHSRIVSGTNRADLETSLHISFYPALQARRIEVAVCRVVALSVGVIGVNVNARNRRGTIGTKNLTLDEQRLAWFINGNDCH